MSLIKKGFLMSSASFQPQNFVGAWLGTMVARPAKCNKVFDSVGLGNAPRDDVVNVKFLSLSGERSLCPAALAARMAVTRPDILGHIFPVSSAPVMFRRPAFPLWMFLFSFADNLSRYVAFVRAKETRLTIKGAKLFPTTITRQNLRLFAIPSCAVIAGHIAKAPSVSVVSVNLKGRATSFTNLFFTRLGFLALASPRAIGAAAAPAEGFAALFAVFLNIFHVRNIPTKLRKIKYFDIACRRVEEAYRQPDMFVQRPPKAHQEALSFDGDVDG